MAQQLLVADGAAGRRAVAQAGPGQRAHLGVQAGLPHGLDAGRDALVELGPGHGEADLGRGADLLVGGHGGGERAAGQLDDLERTHDPAAVAGQDRGGRGRVERGQPLVQGGRSDLGELGLKAIAGTTVRSVKIEIVESGADVQA